MTAAKTPQAASAEDTKTDEAKTPDAEQTVTLSLEQLGELVAAKVAEAVAALPKAETSLAAAPAPVIRFHHPAGQHRPSGFESLANHFKAELIDTAERGQVRTSEGSVAHVEVFQTG